jgi:hypothetical protein
MKTDRVFVLLLVVLLPLSGCFDGSVGDADATDDSSENTTVINNYYNNTTNMIENIPSYFTSTGKVNASTPGAYLTLLTINQSSGEGIMKHDWIGMVSYNDTQGTHIEIRTNSLYVESNCAGNLYFQDIWYAPSSNMNTQTPEWFSGSGLECTHELNLVSSPNVADELWVSIVYQRVPVTVDRLLE